VIFQVQGGNSSFEALQKVNVFYKRARIVEKRLTKQTLDYWREHPSKYALWYVNLLCCMSTYMYDQPFSGQYKEHWYFEPKANTCKGAYR
jgi:N-acetylmuramoyl-L-alanine amidase